MYKKAAILEFCVRIKKYSHAELGSVSMYVRNTPLNKKSAAMFGLDARIALAIFGALSVITGAALYSAIKDAKATAVIVEMQELGKAFEEFYLENGIVLPICDPAAEVNNNSRFRTGLLTNYNGKVYFPRMKTGSATCTDAAIAGGYQLMLFIDDNDAWGDSLGWWTKANCVAGKKCSAYIQKTFDKSLNSTGSTVFQNLDAKVDGGDGAGKGGVRTFKDVNDQMYVWLKVMSVTNPYN